MKIIAPAKLNLYLHITGRRLDGYHLLDSLFAFTEFGDEITINSSSSLTLSIDGPFSSTLSSTSIENNLIFRAALLLKNKYNITIGAHIHLTKYIPVAAGIGGGSSDAAAVLKGLNCFWNLNLSAETLADIGYKLGADIPACVFQKTALISGIGEVVEPIFVNTESIVVLLINPNQPLSTQSVFNTVHDQHRPFSKMTNHSVFKSTVTCEHFLNYLSQTRNDLEPAAIHLLPMIADLLKLLKQQDHCLLARMSGSGPTCFAFFPDQLSAELALQNLNKEYVDLWSVLTRMC